MRDTRAKCKSWCCPGSLPSLSLSHSPNSEGVDAAPNAGAEEAPNAAGAEAAAPKAGAVGVAGAPNAPPPVISDMEVCIREFD